jgi:ribosomal protein L10
MQNYVLFETISLVLPLSKWVWILLEIILQDQPLLPWEMKMRTKLQKSYLTMQKNAPALEVKGAFLDKEVYDAEKIEAFSKLPGKSQLIAMIMSTINAPVQKLAATLQAYVDKKQEEGEA